MEKSKFDMTDEEFVEASILNSWIKDKVASYKYPGREGVPKGSEAPLSPEKYKATFLSLFSHRTYSLSDVAKRCGIKYGVLKVWRTEKRFKKQVEKNTEEFATFFITKFMESSPADHYLDEEIYYYSLELQKKIIFFWLEDLSRFLDPNDENREEKNFYYEAINLAGLIESTIHSLENDRPVKRKNLNELIYLQDLYMGVFHKLRKKLLAPLTKKKSGPYKALIDALDFLEGNTEHYLRRRKVEL